MVEHKGIQVHNDVESVVEGILLKNSRSKVTKDELTMLSYMFKMPQSVEV